MKSDKKKKIDENELVDLSSADLENMFGDEGDFFVGGDEPLEENVEENVENHSDVNQNHDSDYIQPGAVEEHKEVVGEMNETINEDTHSATVDTIPVNVSSDDVTPVSDATDSEKTSRESASGLFDNEKNVRVGKTVVDTLIVNNVVGGKTSATPVVNVTVQPDAKHNKTYTTEDLTCPDSHKGAIVSAKGEEVVKEYNLVKSSNSGKAIVTNRRLIIDSDYRLDIPIEKVSGVSSSSVTQVNVAKIIFGALLIGICLFALLFDFNSLIGERQWLAYLIISVGAVLGLVGLILLCTCVKKKIALNIYGENMIPVLAMSNNAKRAEANLMGTIIVTSKGKDFDAFTGEIGALLIQIKDALGGKLE